MIVLFSFVGKLLNVKLYNIILLVIVNGYFITSDSVFSSGLCCLEIVTACT